MKKSALMVSVAMIGILGSMPAFAANPSDVAIGLAAGGLLGAVIGSSAASAPSQPVYTTPAPAVAPGTVYPAPASAAYVAPGPVYAVPQPMYVAPAPVEVVGPYRWRPRYW